LPDLTSVIVRGRVEGDSQLPTERIAVLAHVASDGDRFGRMRSPCLAGLALDGSFAMDLPAGTYCLQLLDAATGIVFHTTEDLVIGSDPIVLKPRICWLDVDCTPQVEGDPVVVHSFEVTLDRPRDGKHSAFLKHWSSRSQRETGTVECKGGSTPRRWLVPAGSVQVVAHRSYSRLYANNSGMRAETLASESIEVDKPEQALKLVIPAPPTEEEFAGK